MHAESRVSLNVPDLEWSRRRAGAFLYQMVAIGDEYSYETLDAFTTIRQQTRRAGTWGMHEF